MKLTGKFLIEKRITDEGQEIITINGIFKPTTTKDEKKLILGMQPELWISEIELKAKDQLRFKEPKEEITLEEFFEQGIGQNIDFWKTEY